MIPVRKDTQDILVENVNVPLLRQQCQELFAHIVNNENARKTPSLMGVVTLLENMIDIADGEPQR